MWRIVEDNTKIKTWHDTESKKTIMIKKAMLGKWFIIQSDIRGKLGPVTKNKAESIVQKLITNEKIKSLGIENENQETNSEMQMWE